MSTKCQEEKLQNENLNNNGNTQPETTPVSVEEFVNDTDMSSSKQTKEVDHDDDDDKKEMDNTFELHKKAELHEMKEVNGWLETISTEDLLNNAKGLCLGSSIGDSIGSFCEFSTEPISDEKMSEAMQMNGGGPHHVVAGQITDDTELAMCLAKGLMNICCNTNKSKKDDNKENDIDQEMEESESKSEPIFDANLIAIEYKKWLNSFPFDVGLATGNTLYYGPNVIRMKHAANNYNIQCMMKYQNEGNLSNGSIMRCMPLIIYGYKLSNYNLYNLISEDSSLSHSNDIVYLINTMYAIGVRYLLLTTNEMEKHRNLKCIDIMINYLKFMKSDQNPDKSKCKSAETILNWFNEMDKDNKLHDSTKQIAFIKIAIQRVWYHLKNMTSFEKIMYCIVKEGGDTDTNACIVGGIIGAYFGFDKLPKQYVEKVLNCETRASEFMNDRKEFQAKQYLTENIVESLIKHAPNNDNFKMKEYKLDDEKHKQELNKIEYIICNQCHQTRYSSEGAEDDKDHCWYCLECWSRYDD